jgi:L-lactate dehydrogenase complex protein LldG
MATDTVARTEVLRRIRTATGPAADPAAIDAEWSAIKRRYKAAASVDREGLLHQLEDRLRDYDAGVYRTAPDGLPTLIAQVLAERGKRRMAVPNGIPRQWLCGDAAFVEDTRSDVAAIDACEGVLTSATLAIAETGTIVLQDVAGQGRRAVTLLPDYHLCVVDAASVVQTVPEAIALLQATAEKSTTFFSGPSATADIEMTRIKGVHGPRFVDVILVLPQDVHETASV